MLQAINAPITMFIEYINENHPTDEEVVIFSVDEDMESQTAVLGETEEGDPYLGKYWRQTEGPHVILVRKELDVYDTVNVLCHEYAHHYIWQDIMIALAEAEVHDLPGFNELCEEFIEGCTNYIQEKGIKFGFYEETE